MTSWADAINTIFQWPWSTTAAFGGVYVAYRAMRSDIRERRLVQRQQAVIDVITESLAWNRAALAFLSAARDCLRSGLQVDADELNGPAFDQFMVATTAMDRTLQTARMVCPDFKIRVWIAHAHKGIYDLLALIEAMPKAKGDSKENLKTFIDGALNCTQGFATAIDEFGQRGSSLYTVEGGSRYKLENWRWNRLVAAEKTALTKQQTPEPKPPGPSIAPG
jgi:hypothetical protein